MSSVYGYHILDSKNVNSLIKKPIVDVIITSPPYWNLKDYNVEGQIGFGQSYEKYMEDLICVFKKCKEVLKDTGSLWIIVDSFKKGGDVKLLPFELANKLQKEEDFFLQDIIIWQKDKTLPWSSKGKLRNIFEYVLCFSKNIHFKYNVDKLREIELKKWWVNYPERYNPKGKVPSRVWYIPIPVQGWGNSFVRHFCPFPPELIERILLLTTSEKDTVLDPFAGSGSVLAQATVMKRKAIGFDLNSEYKNMYMSKVLPFFKETWKERKKYLKQLDKKRNYLEETILKLRQLKYPISFIKESKKTDLYEEIKDGLIGVIVRGRNNYKVGTDYCFVFNKLNNKEETLHKITKISKNPQMKKFSLTPNFFICDKESLKDEIKRLHIPKKLYLYSKGVVNYSQKEIGIEYFSNDLEEFPVILSNLQVNQKNHLLPPL